MNTEFLDFYREYIQSQFVSSLYRRASEADANAYAERINYLFNITTVTSEKELTARYNEIVTEAAYAGININEVEGNKLVTDFLNQRRDQIKRRDTPTAATDEVKTVLNTILTSIMGKRIATSPEAFDKRYKLSEMRINVRADTQGKFEVGKYYELNPDVDEAYTRLHGMENETAREFFALKHYSLFGKNEKRMYMDAVAEPETGEQPQTEQPQIPSFGGGGFSGGIDLSGLYGVVTGQTQANANMADQISGFLASIANQPREEMPNVPVPEIATPIEQGDILQLVSVSRRDRGLQPFIGFQEQPNETYLESISRTGRQSTFNRF